MIKSDSTLGILGGGQLGLMFAQAASKMGYKVNCFEPQPTPPCSAVADHTQGHYDDPKALKDFASKVSVASYEFENIPLDFAKNLQKEIPVFPDPEVLSIAQQRNREKNFLQDHNFPTTDFVSIITNDDLEKIPNEVGVVKTASSGYDGKGQIKVQSNQEAKEAWNKLQNQECVWEKWVNFDCEVSILVARDQAGNVETYGPIRNDHKNHILDVSTYPANVSSAVEEKAIDLAKRFAKELGLVGIICLEMFVTPDEKILINEIAPRPHNSGHLTIEAFETSQFAQQIRCITGQNLGPSISLYPAAAMVNLLGDLWENGEPDWAVFDQPNVHLHLYGKKEPRPGRKMGHVTVVGETVAEVRKKALELRNKLTS